MEAVLTNGVDCVALIAKFFYRNFRKVEGKDKPKKKYIYIVKVCVLKSYEISKD